MTGMNHHVLEDIAGRLDLHADTRTTWRSRGIMDLELGANWDFRVGGRGDRRVSGMKLCGGEGRRRLKASTIADGEKAAKTRRQETLSS